MFCLTHLYRLFCGKTFARRWGHKMPGDLFSLTMSSLCERRQNRPLTLPGVKVIAYRPIVCVTPYDQTERFPITLESRWRALPPRP